ncbi:hypothetical protein [Priestia megaterium]|uniref:Uncharacterized protein n=1 Tax=Priestia megaterium TaxID=1404 RepID=A0A6M6E5V7_PRIMG|nr:hypothetical protein [Priestia megaterium]QJX80926.1 hypothetical protein FDZ14_33075 [Priestia megaterium]
MKSYSAANLLGKEMQPQHIAERLANFFSFAFNKEAEIELAVEVPQSVYLRTRLMCEFIETNYEIPVSVGEFVSALFIDFIQRNMKKHNPKKVCDELTKYVKPIESLEINDPMNNKIYLIKKKEHSTYVVGFSLDKVNIRRGEMILAEIDELTGNYYTVEELISRLWNNFIKGFSEGNNEKAIEKIFKMISTHIK